MSFIEFLKRLDKIIFLLINHDTDYWYLDNIMLVLRNPLTWIPVYLFIIGYSIIKTGKQAWQFIIFSIINVLITDSLSNVLKNVFERLRPCYDPHINSVTRALVDCGGTYSFPSSHAANHFGLAAFWFFTLFKITGKKWRWFWLWASLIAYAQIYVGKHYPSDIMAGALLGFVAGIAIARAFELFMHSKSAHSSSYFPLEENTYKINFNPVIC